MSTNPNWQPIATLPQPNESSNEILVDVWAKKWVAAKDAFEYRRFVNVKVYAGATIKDRLHVDNSHNGGTNLNEWCPLFWAPIPEGPVGFRNS